MSTSNIFSNVFIYGNCTVQGTFTSLGGSAVSQWTTSGSTIYYSSGNVGIGTAAPVSTFEVTGTGFPGTALTRTAAGDNYGVGIQYSLISNTGSFRGYYARAFGGSLGTIATTNQNQANGYFGIDVANAGLFASDTYGYAGVQFYVAPTISVFNTRVGIGTTNPGSLLTVSGGGSFGSGYNAFTAPTNGMIVQGNVGIGTTNPGVNALQVTGNVVTSGFTSNATNTVFNFDTLTVPFLNATQVGVGTTAPDNTIDAVGSIVAAPVTFLGASNYGLFFRRGFSTSNFYNCSVMAYDHSGDTYPDGISINGYDGVSICTGANTRQERVRVLGTNGYVGIGTASPNTTLDVNGILTTRSDIFTTPASTTLYSNTFTVRWNDSTSAAVGTPKIIINSNGINAGSPQTLVMGVDGGAFGQTAYLDTQRGGVSATTPLAFRMNGTEYMRVHTNGNVGIGTTSPSTALQVNGGQISVPSFVSSPGSPYTTGQQFYFAFNGNLTDSQSGVATTTFGTQGGFVNSAAVRFNGSYYFTFPNSLVTSVVSQTVAFWWCPLSTALQTLFSFSSGAGAVNMNIDVVSGKINAYIATPNQWTVAALGSGAVAPPLGTWVHVALTCSATAATLYYNGVQVDQQTGTYTNGGFGTSTVYVGTNGDGQSRRANCLLDELRVYNIVLTAVQVATLYSSTTFTVNGVSGGSLLTNSIGVGVTPPLNSFDTSGAVAIGSYAGVNQAPNGGLICSGNVGIGTASPGASKMFVYSTVSASTTNSILSIGDTVGYGNGTGDMTVLSGLYSSLGSTNNIVNQIGKTNDTNSYFYGYNGAGYFWISRYGYNPGNGLVVNNGFVGIGTTSPQQALDVVGNIRMNSYMLPYVQYGSASGNYYFVIDFGGATGYHTYVITLRFNQTNATGGSMYFYARDTATTQMSTNEYSETYFRAGQYSTGNSSVIATNNEQTTDGTSRLQIEQSIGTGGRCNYMFDTVYCWANVGQTRCISQGWFSGGNGQIRSITIYNTGGTAYLQTANWTIERFYTS